jgi:hypothetical protein
MANSSSDPPSLQSIQNSIDSLRSLVSPAAALEAKLDAVKTDLDKMSAQTTRLFGILQTKCDTIVRQGWNSPILTKFPIGRAHTTGENGEWGKIKQRSENQVAFNSVLGPS